MIDPLLAPFQLDGRVALVTGGMGGIGRACVERLHAFGATVATTFIPGVETAQTVRAAFPDLDGVTAHSLDLANAASIKDCVASVQAELGPIDILVNNAAVGSATVAHMTDDEGLQDSLMLQINADGTLKLCQEFLKTIDNENVVAAIAPRKLINISSVGGGISAFPGFRLSDGMSKAAVAFLTRQLAAETVHSPVNVFAVCPGATDTPMFQASTLSKMTPQERMAFEKRLPKGRLIKPADIAGVVHFLATDLAQVMHGAVIDASMGLGVRPGLQTEAN
ncbi:MAG: SDR family oxidoreductase [Sulfitobacter sp.]